MSANLSAFLDTIAFSEGTINLGDNGYNVMCGGRLFSDYSKHPNQPLWIPKLSEWSSAAGRYQLLYRFWLTYKQVLNLPDFGKNSQDLIAIQQIKESSAYQNIIDGNFEVAVSKCSHIWASFPGNKYDQRQVKLDELKAFYISRDGHVTG
jgi:muramidase (phage lysozyme)